MATLMQRPEMESGPAENREVAEDKRNNPRILLTVATLLTGLSIAVPAAIMVFVLPRNRAEFEYEDRYWDAGEIWWPYVYAGIALSLGAGLAGIALAARSRVTAYSADEGWKLKAPYWLAAEAILVLSFSVLALILGSVAWHAHPSLGISLIGLGLAGIVAAAWGVGASDPAVTRRWLLPFAIAILLVALLGNVYMFFLFLILGL